MVVGTWQHSLQVRVATTTLLVTGVVVLMIGIFIVDQVAEGVLHAKRDAAIQQANVGLDSAHSAFLDVDASDASAVASARSQVISTLSANGRSAGLFNITVEPHRPI